MLCLVAGCASRGEEGERSDPAAAVHAVVTPAAAKAASIPPTSVVMKLRFRDVDLVVTQAEASPRFTVVDRSGMPLSTNLDEALLRKHHPDLYSAYRFGYARGPFLDARLDLRRESQSSLDGL